ncbi:MAG: flagellar basal body P-ring protein FlgI, partial [Planctomycetaceae bacterium]|nr:flagellar basal body P-ring protein FlgI [Planctomycetaceae bacterium]
KGQESTTIRGIGIVSGLPGTGDDPKHMPTSQAMMRQLARSGMFTPDAKGLNSSKNNALVEVVVTIPGTGARDGEMLDCTILSIGNAKSLKGGVLSVTALGSSLQQDENSVVLGQAWGSVTIEDPATPTTGRIVNGARLHANFANPYVHEGLVTLVLKKEYSRPNMAAEVARTINNIAEFEARSLSAPAKAVNPTTVVVRMPPGDYGEPNEFVSIILDAVILNPPIALPKVTINERLGVIIIDENVEVRPSLINHKNIIAEIPPAEPEEAPRQFMDIDTDLKFRQMNGETVQNVKLKALQASLDAVKASTQDMIDIIKTLHQQGAIIGEVVFVD